MITLLGIEGKSYAVLGLGKSGLSVAASLRASKAKVSVWDDSSEARAEAAKAGYEVADLNQIDLTGFEALVLSPGIPHTYPKPHPAVEKIRAARIPIIGDIELLFQACPKATFVGITGTNGKSTTTALIAHILAASGCKVQVGGNLGTPALSLEPLDEGGIYVLEFSSYQLELIHQNGLDVAVLLNITPDHIDRHGDMKGYSAAKARIFETDKPLTLVIGSDDKDTQALLFRARTKKNLKVEEVSVTHAVTRGVMIAGFGQMFHYTGEEEGGFIGNLGNITALPGQHNWQNAAAAFAACRALHISPKNIMQGIKSFPGLAHRLQLVAEMGGVKFVNDSKATNADAAGKALACYKDIYWIIGGRPKEGGLKGLEEFAPRIRHAFLIGEASQDFATWCEGKMPYSLCNTLDVAVEKAALTAWKEKKSGAVVLLSPACASWDQFKNFEERGKVFINLVEQLRASGQNEKAS